MTTVREATFELFRSHGMTTIFNNPGSTELPMLAGFPDDFAYVLGLQESVVVGMADGYAQASGLPTHVNLHTAPGLGNAVGGIFNAQVNKSPLVITAGQQVRAQIKIEAILTNREATLAPQPYVKYSHEPPRAGDVPGALGRAIHHAMLPPRGPAFVSIPMDDWGQEADGIVRATPAGGPSAAEWRPTRRRCRRSRPARGRRQAGSGRRPRRRRVRGLGPCDRAGRGAVVHACAAQPVADLAPRELLPERQRRARGSGFRPRSGCSWPNPSAQSCA